MNTLEDLRRELLDQAARTEDWPAPRTRATRPRRLRMAGLIVASTLIVVGALLLAPSLLAHPSSLQPTVDEPTPTASPSGSPMALGMDMVPSWKELQCDNQTSWFTSRTDTPGPCAAPKVLAVAGKKYISHPATAEGDFVESSTPHRPPKGYNQGRMGPCCESPFGAHSIAMRLLGRPGWVLVGETTWNYGRVTKDSPGPSTMSLRFDNGQSATVPPGRLSFVAVPAGVHKVVLTEMLQPNPVRTLMIRHYVDVQTYRAYRARR